MLQGTHGIRVHFPDEQGGSGLRRAGPRSLGGGGGGAARDAGLLVRGHAVAPRRAGTALGAWRFARPLLLRGHSLRPERGLRTLRLFVIERYVKAFLVLGELLLLERVPGERGSRGGGDAVGAGARRDVEARDAVPQCVVFRVPNERNVLRLHVVGRRRRWGGLPLM